MGVFVDSPVAEVSRIARDLDLAVVQLHDRETPAEVARLRKALPPGTRIWKACKISDRLPRENPWKAHRLLLDRDHPSLVGGTGLRFDWELLRGSDLVGEVVLAGGIGPENAAEADRLGAWALDLSSGVEEAPGVKSGKKLGRLFEALRGRSVRTPIARQFAE